MCSLVVTRHGAKVLESTGSRASHPVTGFSLCHSLDAVAWQAGLVGSVGVGHEGLHGRELEVQSCSEKAQRCSTGPWEAAKPAWFC